MEGPPKSDQGSPDSPKSARNRDREYFLRKYPIQNFFAGGLHVLPESPVAASAGSHVGFDVASNDLMGMGEQNRDSSVATTTTRIGGFPSFAPGPNISMNQQTPPQLYSQFGPPQNPQVLGMQSGFEGHGPGNQAIPRNQQALHLEQVLRERQAQQQGHGQPDQFTQQSHLPQANRVAPQLNIHSSPPNFGQPVAFQAGPSQQNLPRQTHPNFPQARHPQQQAPVGSGAAKLTPQQVAYQAQVYRDLQNTPGSVFVHSLTGGRALPENRRVHPPQQDFRRFRAHQPFSQQPLQLPQHPLQRPQQQPSQQQAPTGLPAFHSPRPRSSSISSNHFQPATTHRRFSSTGSMAGPSTNNGFGTQGQLGGAQMTPQSSQQSNNDKKPEACGTSNIIPPAGTLPTPPFQTQSPEVVDGYTVAFENENEDAKDGMPAHMPSQDPALAQIEANLARITADRAGVVPLNGQWTQQHINESVPFCKASIIIFEGLAYKADTEPSLGGDPNVPRRTVASHMNRRLTHQEYWLQLDRDREMGIDRFEQYPAVPSPDAAKVFLPFPNKLVGGFGTPDMYPDEDALASIPTPGHLWQYVPREIKPELWYNQIINLQKNIDLWIPFPLSFLFGWFRDTPYGIAHEQPVEIQEAIPPGKECEFTIHEAKGLFHMTMHRWRSALDMKEQMPWQHYQKSFYEKFNWAPTLERLRVLDLMMQIDLVYYFQFMGTPLHPWTKYVQNIDPTFNNIGPVPMTGGL